MHPGEATAGRFWSDDETGELWLQEHVYCSGDDTLVSFLRGEFVPRLGETFVHPERKLIVAGTEHGLRLLDEPIIKTLQREREEDHGRLTS